MPFEWMVFKHSTVKSLNALLDGFLKIIYLNSVVSLPCYFILLEVQKHIMENFFEAFHKFSNLKKSCPRLTHNDDRCS